SFDRGFGLLTVLAAITLFPIVQSSCRTRDFARSLIDITLMASVPVCLLALGEALGRDDLPATFIGATSAARIHSTIGQHLLLASYLAPLIPLAIVRALTARVTTARLPYRALVAGAAWIVGVVLLVHVAPAFPLAWFLLPAWGIVLAVAWDR